MSRRAGRNVIAWENRFETPTAGRLLSGLSREQASLVNHLRKGLLAASNAQEHLVWYGPPWRWTFAFQEQDAARPWAFIIPSPAGTFLAMPLPASAVASLASEGVSKYIRAGLATAPRVGSTYWPQWNLLSRSQADELLRMVQKRFEARFATVA